MKLATAAILTSALALAACAPEAETEDAMAPAETTETTVVTQDAPAEEGSSLTIDGADVDATISEDGVQADINVGEGN